MERGGGKSSIVIFRYKENRNKTKMNPRRMGGGGMAEKEEKRKFQHDLGKKKRKQEEKYRKQMTSGKRVTWVFPNPVSFSIGHKHTGDTHSKHIVKGYCS